jgi:hypothetical protein
LSISRIKAINDDDDDDDNNNNNNGVGRSAGGSVTRPRVGHTRVHGSIIGRDKKFAIQNVLVCWGTITFP